MSERIYHLHSCLWRLMLNTACLVSICRLISAANASQICDGASAVLIVNDRGLKLLGSQVTPLARIHHMSVLGHDPVVMLEAPLPATTRALQKAGMSIDDIDLFEVNEAFARSVEW